jgi:prolyl-tRNA synthetase
MKRILILGAGSAGIAAAVEQNHDKDGIIFPPSITPFEVHLLPVNLKQGTVGEEAENSISAYLQPGWKPSSMTGRRRRG